MLVANLSSCVRGVTPPSFITGEWSVVANQSSVVWSAGTFSVWPNSGFHHERGIMDGHHYCLDSHATSFTCGDAAVNMSALLREAPSPQVLHGAPFGQVASSVASLVATERYEIRPPLPPALPDRVNQTGETTSTSINRIDEAEPLQLSQRQFIAVGCRYYTRPIAGNRLLVHDFRVDGITRYGPAAGEPPLHLYSDDPGTPLTPGVVSSVVLTGAHELLPDLRHTTSHGGEDEDDAPPKVASMQNISSEQAASSINDEAAAWWQMFDNVTLQCPPSLEAALAINETSAVELRWMQCDKPGMWCATYEAVCTGSCGELACADPNDESGSGSGESFDVGSGARFEPQADVRRYDESSTCPPWPVRIETITLASLSTSQGAAALACKGDADDSNLAEPRSPSLQAQLAALSNSTGYDIWLGLVRNLSASLDSAGIAWTWQSDGAPLVDRMANWASDTEDRLADSTNRSDSGLLCAFMSTSDARWRAVRCDSPRRKTAAACQRPPRVTFAFDDTGPMMRDDHPAPGLTCPAPILSNQVQQTAGSTAPGLPHPIFGSLSTGTMILIFFAAFCCSICCIQCSGTFSSFSGFAPAEAVEGHPGWRQLGGDEIDFVASPNGCLCGEVPRFLITDATRGFNVCWIAKWHIHGRTGVLDIGLHRPIQLRRYRLRSANNPRSRDPRCWTLYGVDARGGLHRLHTHRQRGSPWGTERWAWRDFDMQAPDAPYSRLRLRIEANCGDPDTQLGQIALIEEFREDEPLPPYRSSRVARGRPLVEMVPVPVVEGLHMEREEAAEGISTYGVVVNVQQSRIAVLAEPLQGIVQNAVAAVAGLRTAGANRTDVADDEVRRSTNVASGVPVSPTSPRAPPLAIGTRVRSPQPRVR